MKNKKPQTRTAFALEYQEHDLPRVSASAAGEMAEKLLEIAREHDIPVTEDPSLAEALAGLPDGSQIPDSLFIAVAEVLAYAYYLKNKVPAGSDSTNMVIIDQDT